jgi:hypothetical protein
MEFGLEESEKSKCIFVSCDQNAKLNKNVKVGNKSFENSMKFKCWSQLYD